MRTAIGALLLRDRMFDGMEELLKKIRLVEDSLLELKTLRFREDRIIGPSRNDLADEISAFANTRGGVILIGVDDKTREIVGIPNERTQDVDRFTYSKSAKTA